LRLLEALLLLQLRLLLLWLLAREAGELRLELELARGESGGLGLKLGATERGGLSGEASWLRRKACWLWLLHWCLLLTLGELRV
jgi:hypothetical protein